MLLPVVMVTCKVLHLGRVYLGCCMFQGFSNNAVVCQLLTRNIIEALHHFAYYTPRYNYIDVCIHNGLHYTF